MTAVDPKTLGPHQENGHVVVRAYRPAANRVVALLEQGDPVELKPADLAALAARGDAVVAASH